MCHECVLFSLGLEYVTHMCFCLCEFNILQACVVYETHVCFALWDLNM
jgi:hypothetical protein